MWWGFFASWRGNLTWAYGVLHGGGVFASWQGGFAGGVLQGSLRGGPRLTGAPTTIVLGGSPRGPMPKGPPNYFSVRDFLSKPPPIGPLYTFYWVRARGGEGESAIGVAGPLGAGAGEVSDSEEEGAIEHRIAWEPLAKSPRRGHERKK